MSDDRELSPQQEEQVRRLLAEARVDEPIPGDVAGRLDRVLARLADGEPDGDRSHLDELASRRRRKVTTLLVAAAAVVAVGVGAQSFTLDGDVATSGDDATAATAQGPESEELLKADSAGRDEQAAPAEAPPAAMATGSGDPDASLSRVAAPARIRPAFFAIDVERVRTSVDPLATQAQSPTQEGFASDSTQASRSDLCEPGAWGSGRLYLVRYAGNPAVLAFRPAVGETQVVDLLQCGTADILRSVTLPRS